MTTDADTGQQLDAADLPRAIGRLEGRMDAVERGLQEVRDAVRDVRDELRDVNRRIDRLFYALLAAAAGVVGAIFASRFVG
jgi:predicted  nucleic acid-binding Zn-ribbon protein